MQLFEHYYENIIKYDMLNKFKYTDIQQFPKIQKIIVSFNCKNSDFKQLSSSLIALEIITSQKPIIIESKISNISFKIRKGNPVGCKITLRKTAMYVFFAKILLQLFSDKKLFKNLDKQKYKTNTKSIIFELKKILFFPELENKYQFFNKLSSLHIVIVTNSKNFNELKFLLKSFKFLIKLQI